MPSWRDHQREQQQIVVMATRELLRLAEVYPDITPEEFLFIYTAVVDKYGSVAAASALRAVENSRRAAGKWDVLPRPGVADAAPPDQVRATHSWAVNRAGTVAAPAVARMLVGPLGRLVQQRARHTIWNATVTGGTRYARLPGPKACDFCLMLASRGPVYTKETVLATGQSRRGVREGPRSAPHFRNPQATSGHVYRQGRRPEGLRYHDNCDCTAIESYTDADLPQVIVDLEQEWREVTWGDDGMPVKHQLAVWKAHIAETRPNHETVRP